MPREKTRERSGLARMLSVVRMLLKSKDMTNATTTAAQIRKFSWCVLLQARNGFAGLPRVLAECSDRDAALAARDSLIYLNNDRRIVRVSNRDVDYTGPVN